MPSLMDRRSRYGCLASPVLVSNQKPFAFFYFSTACDDDDSACVVSRLFKVVWLLKRAQTMLESNWHAQFEDKQEKKPFLTKWSRRPNSCIRTKWNRMRTAAGEIHNNEKHTGKARAILLFSIVIYANLWRSSLCRSRVLNVHLTWGTSYLSKTCWRYAHHHACQI